ncbi:hypothetical protein L9W92_15635 [Pelotomaculum terephthalicicum JT]|uniref:hypothetical protein n=1 Tax=Pelotomaculum TaxID=191373 RepID=UPI0009CAF3E4|nr:MULTISPECIES: hypothetical protein [Pelotomaculum]MCG9969443.1 hypothetical protein [Pelotomaculum terephthalicicum JT]OPX91507.1 MAG: hypothetical protein A4E54_00215 [Pelotomaculum sp. PtaB.Bin117]OPY63750.1 MAG: hypothetical protein A4E56_00285 [Pelotomaculum sp. PtaU1.Bin065]
MKKRLLTVAVMALMLVMSFAMTASAGPVADTLGALGPGPHSVGVDLYHATLDQLSMGDPAIDSPASVTVASGVATMTLGVSPMTFGEYTGYLEKLEYYDGGVYTDEDVVVVDYDLDEVPDAFIFPITDETAITTGGGAVIGAWQKVQVTVKVEGSSMPVSQARLKIMF